jgi:hypothetical protein
LILKPKNNNYENEKTVLATSSLALWGLAEVNQLSCYYGALVPNWG